MSFVDFASPTKSVLGADSWPDEAIHTIQRERQLRAEAESHAQARWEELRAVVSPG